MKNKIKNNLPIVLIIILACVVYIWKLWEEGLANLYYASGVYSMGQNFHAFFYNSVDAVGFMSIDKPPLGLWIQVLFTKIFGFNGMAILLPEAISGVLSVYLIYRIIGKRFGKSAGIVSALVLTLTPIFASVSRNNTIDGILILMLILASDQAIKAAEKSSKKHLIYASILIGLGFNVKMLQAYMIVPAVYITYLVFSNEKIKNKLLSCTMSVLILIIISLSWITAVDLTPAESRPYVGSSTNNSALNLTLGYNGLGRLIGSHGLGRLHNKSSQLNNNNIRKAPQQIQSDNNREEVTQENQNNNQERRPPDGNLNGKRPLNGNPPRGAGMMRGPGGEAGNSSIFRLYNSNNAGQISWFLLPALIICIFYFYLLFNKKFRDDPKNITIIYFISCFIPMFIYFSLSSGLAHRYYFATFAFSISAIIGIGFWILQKQRKIFIPIIFILTGLSQLYIQNLYRGWIDWILPVCIAIFIIVANLIILIIRKEMKNYIVNYLLFVLLILPAIWSFTPIIYGNNAQIPISGPELKQGNHFYKNKDLSSLITYLEENREEADYLAAVPSAMNMGSELILESGEPVMILGGFSGGDNVLTVDKFEDIVKKGIVKYAIINSENHRMGNNSITEWIQKNGTNVSDELENGAIDGMSLYKLN